MLWKKKLIIKGLVLSYATNFGRDLLYINKLPEQTPSGKSDPSWHKKILSKASPPSLVRPRLLPCPPLNGWLSLHPLLWASLLTQLVKNLPAMQETQVRFLGWEDSLEKEMATHSVFLPGKSHGQRSLAGCSPWGCKELHMTEWLSTTSTSEIIKSFLVFAHVLFQDIKLLSKVFEAFSLFLSKVHNLIAFIPRRMTLEVPMPYFSFLSLHYLM